MHYRIFRKMFKLFGIALMLAIGILLYPLLRYIFSKPQIPGTASEKVYIVGHRGAAGHAPENTLASFQKALDLGVHMIELDLHLTADKELVVIHDATVDRTTNGEGAVIDLTVGEIQKLDAGSWFNGKFKEEKVPTLKEVLDVVNGSCPLLIEIKWPKRGIYNNLTQQLVAILTEYDMISQVIIQSFETRYLKEIQNLNPTIKCHQLILGKSNVLPVYVDRSVRWGYFKPLPGIESVNIWHYYLSPKEMNGKPMEHLRYGAYTLNKASDIKKAVSWGLTYVITDYPDIGLEAISEE